MNILMVLSIFELRRRLTLGYNPLDGLIGVTHTLAGIAVYWALLRIRVVESRG